MFERDSFFKINNTESVTSVNGRQGVVTLSAAEVGALPSSTTIADLDGYAKAEVNALIASLIARIEALEAKTANQSASGSVTFFSGEVQSTDLSIGN